jgi:TATA-box binding protein (TBP) (component of TFIID and TFIIIB)
VVTAACLVAAGGSLVVTGAKVIEKLVKAVQSLQATLRENKKMLAT